MAKRKETLSNEIPSEGPQVRMVRVAAPDEDVPEVPDYPPCDVCGKEFEGKLRCSMCHCAFYCGQECQKADWKKKHKKECAKMAQSCKDGATKFVDAITLYADLNSNFEDAYEIRLKKSEPALRKLFNLPLWEALDNTATYKYAIGINLNGAIENLIKDDFHTFEKKHKLSSGSFTELVMTLIFRNGRNIKPGTDFTTGVDAYRIKMYVRSSPTAFETWLQSSFLILHVFQTHAVEAAQNNDLIYLKGIRRTAESIVAKWIKVFKSSKASKAILLGPSKVADEAAIDRAKWIIQQISKIFYQFPEDSDENKAIQRDFFLFTAMIEFRLLEFGIDVAEDLETMLMMKDTFNAKYYRTAVPSAAATIAKGTTTLTDLEQEGILKRYDQTVKRWLARDRHGAGGGTDGASALSGGGKKKGKKKARKGRRK
eukprot:728158_1